MDTRLPILDLKRAFGEIEEEVRAALDRVFASQSFILGREVRAFEERVESYLELPEGGAIGCASGTDALMLALMALDVGPGDEVIVPTYSFFATAGAVVRLGATPVFADIEPDTYNVSLAGVERKLTPRTKAFIPVHLFGQTVPLEEAAPLLRERGVAVVEDAAQAFGAWRRTGDRILRAGVMGDAASFPAGHVGCYSFFPTKNLGGCGDGGMAVTADPDLAARLRRLRVHGEGSTYFHEEVGLNSRLDALQAAILNVKLPRLEGWNAERRRIADRYRLAFETRGMTDRGMMRLPAELDGNYHIYHQYVVRVPERDAMMAWLEERGLSTRVYYPLPLHLQPCFAFLGGREEDCPEAEKLAKESLALPIFPGLLPEEQETLAAAMEEFLRRHTPL